MDMITDQALISDETAYKLTVDIKQLSREGSFTGSYLS